VIALALLALQAPPSPPPPPGPPPTPISVTSAYEFVCDITPRDGPVLTVQGKVDGVGKKRRMRIVSSHPAIFPGGKAVSTGARMLGARQVPSRYIEPFRMVRREGRFSMVLWWNEGRIESGVASSVPAIGYGPVTYFGKSSCRVTSFRD
jgi:hypothetical protein